MYIFVFTSLGMIFGYILTRYKNINNENKNKLTENHQSTYLIPKFIGKKSLAIDFSNVSKENFKNNINISSSQLNFKIAIPVATVKNEIAQKIGIYYTENNIEKCSNVSEFDNDENENNIKTIEKKEDELIKFSHKLVFIPFSQSEVSIFPPFSSFPQRFKNLYLCFEDSNKRIEHKIDVSSLPLGIGWWSSEIDKLVQMI
jgi:hypothetical protein